jgi:hypothetical protein
MGGKAWDWGRAFFLRRRVLEKNESQEEDDNDAEDKRAFY